MKTKLLIKLTGTMGMIIAIKSVILITNEYVPVSAYIELLDGILLVILSIVSFFITDSLNELERGEDDE